MKIAITADYTLVVDPTWRQLALAAVYLECDSTAGPIAITLPLISAFAGFRNMQLFVVDVAGTAAANPITIVPVAPNTIDGGTATIDVNNGAAEVQIMSDNIWGCFESAITPYAPQTVRQRVIRVDALYGNDTLAAADPYNTNVTPFQTLTAAHAAAQPTDTIVLFPAATYSFSGSLYRDGGAIEIMSGSTLQWNTPGTVISGGTRATEFTIYGEGILDLTNTIDTDATANKIINILCHKLITRSNGLCYAAGTPLFRVFTDIWDVAAGSTAAGFFVSEAPIIQAKCKAGTWATAVFAGFVFSGLASSGNDESYFHFDLCNITVNGLFICQNGVSADYKINTSGKVKSVSTGTTFGVITTTGSPAAKINSKMDITCIKYAHYITGGSIARIEGSLLSTNTAGTETPAVLVNHVDAQVSIMNSNITATITNGGAVWAQQGLVLIDDCQITNEIAAVATAYPLKVGVNGGSSAGLVKAVLKNLYLLSDPDGANAGGSPSIYIDAASGNDIFQYIGNIITNGGVSANVVEVVGVFTVQTFATFSKVPKV